MNLICILLGSIFQSSICALTSIICALPLMHMARGLSHHTRLLLCSFCFVLAIMPGTAAAVSVIFLCPSSGICSVILAHLLLNIPLAFHLLYGDFFRITTTLYAMARALGARRMRSYYDGILAPLVPSLVRTCVTIFILCFSSTSIPLLLGDVAWSYTFDSALVMLYQTDNTVATVICTVLRLLIIVLVLCVGNEWSYTYASAYKATPLHDDRTVPVHRGWIVIGSGIIGCLLFPIMSMCVRYMQNISCHYNHILDVFGESLFLIVARSVMIAVLSSTIAVGLALFYFYRQSRYMTLLSAVPWLVGGSACAAVSALVVSYVPMLSCMIVIGCHALLCFPFIVRMLTIACNQYDTLWTAYAHSCGATRWHIFITLQLPYVQKALCASWSLSFGLSIAQVGVSQLLADAVGMTLPAAIRILKASGRMNEAIVLSICSMVIVFIPTLLIQYCSGVNMVQPVLPLSAAPSHTRNRSVLVRQRDVQHSV